LIGLPILFFIFNPENQPNQCAIGLNLPTDDTTNTDSFSRAFIDSFIATKKVEQIYLDSYAENKYLKNRQLDFIDKEVQRIQFTHDTSMILQIKLGATGTFGNFVTLINIAHLYRVRTFVIYDDQFYFYANDPPSNNPTIDLKDIKYNFNPLSTQYLEPSQWDIFFLSIRYRFDVFSFEVTQSPLLSIGFVIFILLPSLLHLFITRRQRQ
jgi:hypothetical protein